MLVISRKPGETLLLGSDIKISLISISGDKVSIGIDAPKHVPIIREELADTIEANKNSDLHKEGTDYNEIASMLKKGKNVIGK